MKKFNVIKVDKLTNERYAYGVMTEEELKAFVKGYKYNGFRYERKTKSAFIVVYADEVEARRDFAEILARYYCGETIDSAIQSVLCKEG